MYVGDVDALNACNLEWSVWSSIDTFTNMICSTKIFVNYGHRTRMMLNLKGLVGLVCLTSLQATKLR